ncbi:DNA/RNA non-specific endonuclease [Shuttleworthella satelles]|uniref:Type VII secretion system protein EssD-like domain-containing protein n=1 Tax=Shuttleworthella satelles DSM 14600 TaxID=626523 RepID=C4G8S1_9FIRM|nr:DNA/RNA non-specific endonuclease [Shuttleworthia satelles]EEP29018.1 hypothetical protein GCWU000342_00368 [Shuttleworthia satelles DSM 14600]
MIGGRSKRWGLLIVLALAGLVGLNGCGSTALRAGQSERESSSQISREEDGRQGQTKDLSGQSGTGEEESRDQFDPADIPAYEGSAFAVMHRNRPYFSREETDGLSGQSYSELDSMGRCGVAWAKINPQLMPTAKRGEIGAVKPSGWHTIKYADIIKDRYLYNRCHLIGYQLTGQNANPKNLITGTRYMNVSGMEPFEDLAASYVKRTGNSLLYRVTPVFRENELVARGVLMEAYSVSDAGRSVSFCVFCYNVQPGIEIDYRDGSSHPDGSYQLSDGDYFSRGFTVPKISTGSFQN